MYIYKKTMIMINSMMDIVSSMISSNCVCIPPMLSVKSNQRHAEILTASQTTESDTQRARERERKDENERDRTLQDE